MRNLLSSILLMFLCFPTAACAGAESGGGSSGTDAAGPNLISSSDDAAGDDGSAPPSTWPGIESPDATTTTGASSDASLPLAWESAVPADDAAPAATPDASCVQPLGAGVLAIDELLIESVAGTGDYGEWIEVQSTSGCAVNLHGLHGECPVGMKLHTFDVTGDIWLPPSGTFLIADVGDPAINHYLPGLLVTWAGQPGDVLRNEGSTVTLTVDGTLVDTLTYPSLKPRVGASIAFPASCPPSSRTDWSSWQTSTFSWFPGFYGTPNAPNDDVSCP